MSAQHMTRVFLSGMACAFVVASCVHLSAIIFPYLKDTSSAMRHGVFVAINLYAAWGVWVRSAFFAKMFPLLVVQQLYSHGSAGWNAWFLHGHVDYPSLAIIILLPITWGVLYRERRW